MAYLSKEQQKELAYFLKNLDSIGSNVSFVKFIIPWYRKWSSFLPLHFLKKGDEVGIVDESARTVSRAAHVRLDKLHNI